MKFALCILGLALAAEAAKVSPVQKVIELLDDLKVKVQNDLDAEGKAMDEYTAWCDKEIADTDYAIGSAAKSIDNYKATMEEAQNTIQAKEAEVAERGTTISAKEKEAADAQSIYADQKSASDAEEQELINSIDELSGAIVQLKKGASLIQ